MDCGRRRAVRGGACEGTTRCAEANDDDAHSNHDKVLPAAAAKQVGGSDETGTGRKIEYWVLKLTALLSSRARHKRRMGKAAGAGPAAALRGAKIHSVLLATQRLFDSG